MYDCDFSLRDANEKNLMETNKNVTKSIKMEPLMQAIWGDIWKRTVAKSQTLGSNWSNHGIFKLRRGAIVGWMGGEWMIGGMKYRA